jgi:membrane glycosyltransferase
MPGSFWWSLYGPLIAVALVGLVTVLIWWSFRPNRPKPAAHGYGLLVPVATCPREQDATQVIALLRAHDVRATSTQHEQQWQVLVFSSDEQAARQLLEHHSGTTGV